MITLLAAQAPRLDRALKKVAHQGGEAVLIDGTLISTQRRTGRPTGGTTPVNTTIMACTFSP
ncbi:hypothetical protein [Streptomyces sp. Ncost-T10-10d]|uniref:hypothetical protein n=1 Tax=Streptomyces sp. Ncost-T10-10d TaxID=1839774 RepID=UPI00081E503B|nr:hypothetical protein [Streptomyces sp. Ncost-T10-10d]SCF98939.1 hypothetical protein GA0115254_131585 [Streptomyces sp. Ncost-T10-10d]